MKGNKLLLWGLVVVWMGCIFYMSHQPATKSSELSSNVMDIVLGMIQAIIPIDVDMSAFHTLIRKAAHFSAYLILGTLLYVALGKVKQRWVIAFVISVLYAISDEVHQLFIPGRSGEMRDVFIDSAGAITGILLCIFILQIMSSIKR